MTKPLTLIVRYINRPDGKILLIKHLTRKFTRLRQVVTTLPWLYSPSAGSDISLKRLSDQGDISSERGCQMRELSYRSEGMLQQIYRILANGKGRRLRAANIATRDLQVSRGSSKKNLVDNKDLGRPVLPFNCDQGDG